MTRPALLDNVTHRNLRVRTERSAALGDARQSALALPAEFRHLQAHFPIVFQLVEDDAANAGFQPVVLFGLEEGQNLFLTDKGWDAPALPMALQRDPFMIGRAPDDTLQLHIDMDSPRIVRPEEGEVGHGGLPAATAATASTWITSCSLMEHLHAQAQQLPALHRRVDPPLQLLEPFAHRHRDCPGGQQGRLTGLFHGPRGTPGGAARRRAGSAARSDGYLLPIYMQTRLAVSACSDLVERQNRALGRPCVRCRSGRGPCQRRTTLPAELLTADRPLCRCAARFAHWPVVQAARRSDDALAHYLMGFYRGMRIGLFQMPPEAQGPRRSTPTTRLTELQLRRATSARWTRC